MPETAPEVIECPQCPDGRGFYFGKDDDGKPFKQECTRCDGWGLLFKRPGRKFYQTRGCILV